MLHRAMPGLPGIALGSWGFSWNSSTRLRSSTCMTPKREASATGVG